MSLLGARYMGRNENGAHLNISVRGAICAHSYYVAADMCVCAYIRSCWVFSQKFARPAFPDFWDFGDKCHGNHQIGHCLRPSLPGQRGGMPQYYHSRHTVQTARNRLPSRYSGIGHCRRCRIWSPYPCEGGRCIVNRPEDASEGGRKALRRAASMLAIHGADHAPTTP